ncbi:XRE family transcriptional regulator [Holzapfeliella sp. He02]|uniref:XRE family transcriptional regulator n=1 Tax=Holzapfeliella saturejae TaxID=3082953 RepID=A0ABU8SI63_9LACO
MSKQEKEIKKRLIDLELKQIDVINHFGWSKQYFRDLIKGKTEGPAAVKNLKKVCHFLGISSIIEE